MAKKKPFVLRVQPEMLEALERWAQDEFRSINGQIEYLLHQSLQKAGRLKKKNAQVSDGVDKDIA
jgi:hypothetical protein